MKKVKGFSKVGVVVAVLLAVFAVVGLTALVIDANSKQTNFDEYDFTAVIKGDIHNSNISDHVKGDLSKANVVIVEYADFQCGYCALMNARVNAAVEKADGKLAVIYRNYLLSYHQNGTAAASAAEAAGLQGYWKEYADKLFEEQDEWAYATGSERTALFDKYFQEVTEGKGDLTKFNEDMSSEAVSKKISFDMGIGKRVDIAGTPAFYYNGKLIDFSNKDGAEIDVDGKVISWEGQLTGEQFTDMLVRMTKAKDEALKEAQEKSASEK